MNLLLKLIRMGNTPLVDALILKEEISELMELNDLIIIDVSIIYYYFNFIIFILYR